MSFTQITVTGTYKLADGSAAEGLVRFTPRAAMHNENVVVSAPVVATLNGSGAFSVSLAATDDPGTLTADGATATYRVELVLAGQPARNYQIVLGHADVTRNLADIITVTPTLTAADWLTQTQADALYTSFDTALDNIADLTPSNDDVLQLKSGQWANRTIAQLATDLTASAVQPKDADLTTIGALSPSNDDVLQRKAGAWTNRTMAQVKTDLALTKTDVGLSNVTNNAQVTGVTAGDGTITVGGTSTAPTVAVGTGIAQSKVTNLTTDLAAKLDTSAAPELIRDTMGTALVAGTNVTITPNDGADTITIAATGSSYTSENARDDIATALVAGTGIAITPNDGADTITIAQSGGASGLGSVLVANAPSGDTTGATDQAHLQSLLTTAQSTNGTLYLRAGIYYVTGLVTSQSFAQPNLRGIGTYQTTLRATSTNTAVRYVGGSGSLTGAEISDMTIDSVGAGTGIELRDCGGVVVTRVRFENPLAFGLVYHNFAASSFAEANVAKQCWFSYLPGPSIYYKRTSGTQSFHGSGFQNCWFNQRGSLTTNMIKIDTGSLIYNAPWDGLFFLDPTSTAQPVIQAADEPITAFGTIRTENPSGTFTFYPGTGDPWYHDGGVFHHGSIVNMGDKFFQIQRRASNSDGSETIQRLPWERRFSLVSGQNTLTEIGDGISQLVSVHVSASNYDQSYLLDVFQDPFNNAGSVTQVANTFQRNTVGWGASTFAVTNVGGVGVRLTVTNASFTGTVTCRVAVVDMLNRWNFPLR